MNRISSLLHPQPEPEWHAVFLRMAGRIRKAARIAFRHYNPEEREEKIQAVLCNACAAVARLAELGKLDLCYASVLSRFSIAQVKDGRITGGHLNCLDISSRYCQRLKDSSLNGSTAVSETTKTNAGKVLVPDRRCSARRPRPYRAGLRRPAAMARRAETPRPRIAQFARLRARRTCRDARKFRLTSGRVSQLRRELAR